MMNLFDTTRNLALTFTAIVALHGCTPQTTMVNMRDDRGPQVLGLDYRDFESAAAESISKMLATGAVDHPKGGRYVLAISRVTNDTQQYIDTDQLVKKIRVALLDSGKVVVTTAVGLTGPEDPMSVRVNELGGSGARPVLPELSLSGKILQRNLSIDRRTQQVEYYFNLTLTQIRTGLAIWENETVIGKRGSSRTVTW
jgi:penicillin-binding protein activator